MSEEKNLITIPIEFIQKRIYMIRNRKVMFDSDLAEMYGVETGQLNRAAKRNIERFPEDFMFKLNIRETEIWQDLKCQTGISNKRGGSRHAPYVFTEQGVAMLSSVLRSKRAIQVNIQIMRTFTKLREILAGNKELREKIEEMEKKYDQQFKIVFDAIKHMLAEEPKKNKIGF